jgi:hypothetical protein
MLCQKAGWKLHKQHCEARRQIQKQQRLEQASNDPSYIPTNRIERKVLGWVHVSRMKLTAFWNLFILRDALPY